MTKLFFGKMNKPEQVEEKKYKTTNRGFLGDIQVGDYAIIKLEKETQPATVKRLWKLSDINEDAGLYTAVFEEICSFGPIPLLQFEALDLFVLDMNLLNKCNKQTQGLSFYRIALTSESAFEELISSSEAFSRYVSDRNHYRKMIRLESVDSIDPKSINVQFYKEGDSWLLADAPFIGEDLKDNYDSSQFNLFGNYGNKGSNSSKDKMYNFLSGVDIEVPMMGIWDLFCGTVKENTGTKKKRTITNKRNDFIKYCTEHGVLGAADQYEAGIRAIEKDFSEDVDKAFERDKCKELLKKIDTLSSNLDKDRPGNRRNWKSYLNKYIEYKTYMLSKDDEQTGKQDEIDILSAYDYSQAKHMGINKVFYGTPGCGKSYYVENEVLVQEEIDIENSVFRTTFFPDYTNTDFVGQVLPNVSADGDVSYEFIPGPFTKALKCAIDNPEEKVALVIEELNRGNAPSIFGDIFQLLDRKEGTSRYSVFNSNIQSYLKKKSIYDLEYIRIPSNLYIFATMNTSDQNVFTLDTAFKRRWKFEKLTNDFLGKDSIGSKYVPGLKKVTWKVFVETINKYIITHATTLSAEDKQLGKYFVDEDLLMDNQEEYTNEKLKEFAYKVFEYLWTDVAKFNRNDWFVGEVKSLDILIYKFLNHENIFVPELADKLPIYIIDEEEE